MCLHGYRARCPSFYSYFIRRSCRYCNGIFYVDFMIRWLKRELPRIIPVFLFFLIFFTVINWTETYLFEQAGITPFKFAEIAVSALLIAKIVLVANLLPFIALFQKKPHIYSILWKTFIYWTLLI